MSLKRLAGRTLRKLGLFPKQTKCAAHVEDYAENTEAFWDTCDPVYAHLKNEGRIEGLSPKTLSLFGHRLDDEEFHKWTARICAEYGIDDLSIFTGKHVLEYGIGSCLLGAILYERCQIARWTGIDISGRQLQAARERHATWPQSQFFKSPTDFAAIAPDLFISHACIQHFPTEECLHEFLRNLNRSGAADLLLQTRYAEQTKFSSSTPSEACVTNVEYLSQYLNAYELSHEGSPTSTVNRYQYTRWQRKAPS